VFAPDGGLVAALRLAPRETAALRRQDHDFTALTPEPAVGMGYRFPRGLKMFVLETDTRHLKNVFGDGIDASYRHRRQQRRDDAGDCQAPSSPQAGARR